MPPTISNVRRRLKRRSLAADGPLGEDEFASLMAALGPFETAPHLAVAVSGGADSLALGLLADRWVRAKGGRITVLTVDHGLRPASATEAAGVATWAAGRGITHQILAWSGDKPSAGLQAAAREARYALLGEWCRQAGVLHLLLAHHLDDQAETLLLRLGRGSGVDGLAAMAPVTASRPARLLRPLLTVPRLRLAATLTAAGQSWIDDPSNANDRFRRVRLRGLMPALAAEGLDAARLAATAARLGRARQALDEAARQVMVAAVTLHPAGFARLRLAPFSQAAAELRLGVLAALCRSIGGGAYRPRLERLQRLLDDLDGGGPVRRRTFAGCVLVRVGEEVVICREPAAVAGAEALADGRTLWWDRRFLLRLEEVCPMRVAALGAEGWRELRLERRWPAAAGASLPAIFDDFGLAAVPHLRFRRRQPAGPVVLSFAFSPVYPLAGVRHCLV